MRIIKNIVPFTKDLTFESKFAEITSMSLEHTLDVQEGSLAGEFLITGDYKTHAVSVNKEAFEFKLPFSLELTDNIDISSVVFEITDFAYEVLNDHEIRVNIEFSVNAEEVEEVEKIEEVLNEESEREEVEVVTTNDLADLIDLTRGEEAAVMVEEKKEEVIVEETPVVIEPVEEIREQSVADVIDEKTIITSVAAGDDNVATYHIHIVQAGENIETICTLYNSSIGLISNYNDLSLIDVGSKLIIPENEE